MPSKTPVAKETSYADDVVTFTIPSSISVEVQSFEDVTIYRLRHATFRMELSLLCGPANDVLSQAMPTMVTSLTKGKDAKNQNEMLAKLFLGTADADTRADLPPEYEVTNVLDRDVMTAKNYRYLERVHTITTPQKTGLVQGAGVLFKPLGNIVVLGYRCTDSVAKSVQGFVDVIVHSFSFTNAA